MQAASLAPAQQADRQMIETNSKTFIESFNKGDAAAVAGMYTADARLLPPNGPMVEGRAEIQKYWQGAIGAGLKLVSLEAAHVETGGNLIVEVGRYKSTTPGSGGSTATDEGKYVVVWKREGRNWKLAADIFNSNMPVTTSSQ